MSPRGACTVPEGEDEVRQAGKDSKCETPASAGPVRRTQKSFPWGLGKLRGRGHGAERGC